MVRRIHALLPVLGGLVVFLVVPAAADQSAGVAEPPAINPFGRKPTVREDAVPGYVETSDGAVHPGRIYLTRDKRLKIYDDKLRRQREVPLRAIEQIECKVIKQWMEKEWKFKQLASSEKMYTGRSYPAREYIHVITLAEKRTITGPLSAIVYVDPSPAAAESGSPGARAKPERYLLNKRDKGKVGGNLKSLVYVRLIKLGEEALAEGRKKAAEQRTKKKSPRGTAAPPGRAGLGRSTFQEPRPPGRGYKRTRRCEHVTGTRRGEHVAGKALLASEQWHTVGR